MSTKPHAGRKPGANISTNAPAASSTAFELRCFHPSRPAFICHGRFLLRAVAEREAAHYREAYGESGYTYEVVEVPR